MAQITSGECQQKYCFPDSPNYVCKDFPEGAGKFSCEQRCRAKCIVDPNKKPDVGTPKTPRDSTLEQEPEYLKGMQYTWNTVTTVPDKDFITDSFLKLTTNLIINRIANQGIVEGTIPVKSSNTNEKLVELETCNCMKGDIDCCTECSDGWAIKQLRDLGLDALETPNLIDGIIEGLRRLFSGDEPTPQQIVESCRRSFDCIFNCVGVSCITELEKIGQCKIKNKCRAFCQSSECCPECAKEYQNLSDCGERNAFFCSACWNNSENFNRCQQLFESIKQVYDKKNNMYLACLYKFKTDPSGNPLDTETGKPMVREDGTEED